MKGSMKPHGDCVKCMNKTGGSVKLQCHQRRFKIFLCDDCYYEYDDEVILPVPFGSLFGNPNWDFML